MKILSKVTVTGADDFTPYEKMVEIQEQFPFVEFAILVKSIDKTHTYASGHQTAFSYRFPSIVWLNGLNLYSKKLNLAVHLCGNAVHEFLEYGTIENSAPHVNLNAFGRIQINTHGELHKYDIAKLSGAIKLFREKQFIFQLDKVNEHIMNETMDNGCENISGLYDMSHGTGILADEWRKPNERGIFTGYAGGLSPENVKEQLSKIENITSNTWIDAETHLRRDQIFHIPSVVQFLENSKEWVRYE